MSRRDPPEHTRFKKGRSGNPKGRPKRTVEHPPYEAVLGQIVEVPDEHGKSRQITLERAFMLQLAHRGIQNDQSAMRLALAGIEKLRKVQPQAQEGERLYILVEGPMPSTSDLAVRLRMAVKTGADGPNPRVQLQPWIVEAALARLGERTLTAEEQREVWSATRMPRKVSWPEWWTQFRGTGKRRPKAPWKDAEGFLPPCAEPRTAGSSKSG